MRLTFYCSLALQLIKTYFNDLSVDCRCALLNTAAHFAGALAQAILYDGSLSAQGQQISTNAAILKLAHAISQVELYFSLTGTIPRGNDVKVGSRISNRGRLAEYALSFQYGVLDNALKSLSLFIPSNDDKLQIPEHLQTHAILYQLELYLHLQRWSNALSLVKDCQKHCRRISMSLLQKIGYAVCNMQAAPTECE